MCVHIFEHTHIDIDIGIHINIDIDTYVSINECRYRHIDTNMKKVQIYIHRYTCRYKRQLLGSIYM